MDLSKIKKMSIGVSLVLIALPMTIWAAGLGQLNVTSGIGQPLKADIQLLSATASEMASLKARIAPQAAYAAQGLERPHSHNDISIKVAKSLSGKNILKLQSNQPITEPFLDMLVEVEWETGRVIREYTALLDPPGYDGAVNTSQVQVPTIKAIDKASTNAVMPIKEVRPVKNTVGANATSSIKPKTETLADDYLTRRGDTLSKIARQMKPEGVSLDQMLVGLYEANPEAFSGENMNRLKVGKILQPPTEEALNVISRKEARKEIKVQTASWNIYRNKLAGVVADSAPEMSEVDSQTTSGKIQSAAEDKSISESEGPQDVVKLSSGDSQAEADMQAKIVSLQEEVSAREKGLQEAQERTVALEKQIEDMQKLLTLRSDALSEAQLDVPTTVEGEMKDAVVEQVTETTEVAEQPSEVAPVEPVKPVKPMAKPKPAELAVEQPSIFASILDTASSMLGNLNTTLLAGGAGVIALVTGLWLYLRSKRRKNLDDFEQGIMTSGGLKANTVFGNTSGASVDTGDTSFLTDFSQSTSGGMIDTNDVDPIAEAEVYMAYGRDAQAEEILKDAISKEPKRYELHLKLLEMYAASKDMSAFETVSGELFTTLGAEDPTWAKVAEIGIKLEPNNPLYQAKGVVGTTTDAVEGSDQKLDASDFSDSPMAAEADLDFSLNDGAQEEVQPQASEEIDKATDVKETVLDISNVSEILDTQDSALEFDLNAAGEQPVEEVLSEVVAEEVSFTNTMPDLDLPSMEGDQPDADTDNIDLPLDSVAEQPETAIPSELSLDLPILEKTDKPNTIEVVDEAGSGDLTLDTGSLTEDVATSDVASSELKLNDDDFQANVLDMTDISLEVNDDVNEAIAEATQKVEVESVSSGLESEEVETKLELVAAYIDMDDKEGAKELLDEVLKEGGANQRKRAEELLATLS